MVDAYYNDAPNNLLGNGVHGNTDLDTDDIRIILYDETDDPRNLADVDRADIIAGAQHATSANLTTKTVGGVGDGIFDHVDEVFATVAGPDTIESLIYFEWSGADTTDPLLWVLDSWTGLPVTANGGDITVAPAAGGVIDIS